MPHPEARLTSCAGVGSGNNPRLVPLLQKERQPNRYALDAMRREGGIDGRVEQECRSSMRLACQAT